MRMRPKELVTAAIQSFKNFTGDVPDFEFFNPETVLIILVLKI